jgi:hypothetical protein
MRTYDVRLTREGNHWLADVPALDGAYTYASNLTDLDRYIRETIVLAAGLAASSTRALTLNWSREV